MYWSTGSLAKLEDLFYTASVSEDAHSTAPEAIVKTVKTILACIKSRLEGEWENLGGICNKAGMDTLREIMTEDIPLSQ